MRKGGTKDTEEPSAEKIGVVLLNLGGPDSLEAVRPFLYNLFSDREIIQLGPPVMQKPLAWLIAAIRSKKTGKLYSLIGGKSPIADLTKAQAIALEETLNAPFESHHSTLKFKVYVAMRYWHPFIEDVVAAISREGIRKIIGLSLYPQFSVATSGSTLSKFKEVSALYGMETSCISSWHNHPLYIEALVDVIRKGLESFSRKPTPPLPPFAEGEKGGIADDIHILFSAHSLPQKIIDQGDPYVDQTRETIGEITKRISVPWHLCYQSKSGPVKWLEPSTDEKLEELAGKGVRNVLIVPISFVSDHIETLYEIDILYHHMAEKLGIHLRRTDSLNTHPLFIEALRDMVAKSLEDKATALP
jgi:ferrochelatase